MIRSGRGAKLHPCSRRTPCTRTVPVPAPCTRPPHRFRNAARSSISGSRAAPRRVVSPLCQRRRQQQGLGGPTLGNRRVMSAPCSPAGAVSSRRSPSSCGQAPICTRPARCRSMGRAPMRQPRAARSVPGPAGPAAGRRTGWMPASGPPGLPPASRCRAPRPPAHPPPAAPLCSLHCAAGQGSRPHRPAPAPRTAALARCTAGTLPAAAAHCSWPPGPVPFHSAAARP